MQDSLHRNFLHGRMEQGPHNYRVAAARRWFNRSIVLNSESFSKLDPSIPPEAIEGRDWARAGGDLR
jgi:hypothetical protein